MSKIIRFQLSQFLETIGRYIIDEMNTPAHGLHSVIRDIGRSTMAILETVPNLNVCEFTLVHFCDI